MASGDFMFMVSCSWSANWQAMAHFLKALPLPGPVIGLMLCAHTHAPRSVAEGDEETPMLLFRPCSPAGVGVVQQLDRWAPRARRLMIVTFFHDHRARRRHDVHLGREADQTEAQRTGDGGMTARSWALSGRAAVAHGHGENLALSSPSDFAALQRNPLANRCARDPDGVVAR